MNTLPITEIRPSLLNPRRVEEDGNLRSLAESIRDLGIIEPLVVRKKGGAFELITGERRWHAARLAGLESIPVVIREQVSDQQAAELVLVENLQREDLDPIEEAEGYRRMTSDFGYTQTCLGRLVGKSQNHISRTLSLLSLPADVQEKIRDGRLSASHGFRLASKHLAPAEASALAAEVVLTGKSVHALADELRPLAKRLPTRSGAIRNRQVLSNRDRLMLRTLLNAVRDWSLSEADHQVCGCETCQQVKRAFEAVRGLL